MSETSNIQEPPDGGSDQRLVECCVCNGKGRVTYEVIHPLVKTRKCYTCDGKGKRPTCYTCKSPLYRSDQTDGWFCCSKCDEAKARETTDFLSLNAEVRDGGGEA